MLVVSRKVGQRIVVGEGVDKIVIEVTKVQGNRVSIAISAPDGVRILRGELEDSDDGGTSSVTEVVPAA